MKKFKKFNEAKRVIRRNLPINTTYKLVDSYYSGGLLENPQICANCDRPITNVGVVKNQSGEEFSVGLDCAETLSGIGGSMDLLDSIDNFNEAKAIRSKIRTNTKKHPEARLFVVYDKHGEVSISFAESEDSRYYFMIKHEINFMEKYMPDLMAKIENPNKKGFVPKYSENFNFGFDFSNITPPKLRSNDHTFTVNEYEIKIKDIQKKAMSGNINDMVGIFFYKDGELLEEKSTYMPRGIKDSIIWKLNELDFDNYGK